MEKFDDILDDAKYKRCILKLKNKEIDILEEMNPATIQGLIKVLGTLPKSELKELITIIVDNNNDVKNVGVIFKSFKGLLNELQSDWDEEYEVEKYKSYIDPFRRIFKILYTQKILWDLLTEDVQKEQYLDALTEILKSTENEFIPLFEDTFRNDVVILEIITKYKLINNL